MERDYLRLSDKPVVLLLGPSRQAVSGVSTHLNQLFGSQLAAEFGLVQLQVGSEGRSESTWQKLVRFASSPAVLVLYVLRYRPKIVHLNTSIEPKSFWRDAVYLFVCKCMRRKVVYQIHGGEPPDRFFQHSRLLTRFLRWVLSLPDAVVVLAECESVGYKAFAPINYLRTIPNAIDLAEFGFGDAKSFQAERLVVGYIGRLAEDKGIFDLVEALGILRRDGRLNVQFRVAGAGPAESELKEAISRNGLDEHTDFLGPVFGRNKLEFWRTTDVFIFPTYHREGLPYTVLESLASGTPMITTRVGGIPDAVVDGVHGYFVQPRAPQQLADAIDRLTQDRHWLRTASVRCAEQARQHYGIDRLAGQFSEVYRLMLL